LISLQLEQLKNSYKFLYHASIYIKEGVYIDPYKIEKESHDAKYIFITHSHYDHYSLIDIKKIINEDTLIIATKDCIDDLKRNGLCNKVLEVSPNETYIINDLKVTIIPSYNKEKAFHPISNNWVGYLIEINNIIYYVIGDSDYNEYMDKIKCDILFVPIGGTYTMDYIEASQLTNSIKPKIVVPIHYNSLQGLNVDKKEFLKRINKEINVD